jgi:hypothetical protein
MVWGHIERRDMVANFDWQPTPAGRYMVPPAVKRWVTGSAGSEMRGGAVGLAGAESGAERGVQTQCDSSDTSSVGNGSCGGCGVAAASAASAAPERWLWRLWRLQRQQKSGRA